MPKLNVRLLCLLVCLAFTLGTAPAYSWCEGEYDLNETLTCNVSTANDLDKFFEGRVRLVGWYSDRFEDCQSLYNSGANETTIRWFLPNPTPVLVGETVRVCFSSNDPIKQKYQPQWTLDQSIVGPAGPGLSFEAIEDTDPLMGLVIKGVGDQSENYTLNFLKVGVVADQYPLDSLWGSYVSGISWEYELTDVTLAPGQELTYTGLPIPTHGSIIFWAEVVENSDPENVVEYVGQYAQFRVTPSLTEWGLVVLAALVLATGVWIVIRRKRTASSLA